MDDLIQEFITETSESLGQLDQDMVQLERNGEDPETLGRIFRVMHTIKGTCGFLGLARLEKVAHAGEDVLGKFRDGTLVVNPSAVSAVLSCVDTIRAIVDGLQSVGAEPDGDDTDLIRTLRAVVDGETPVASPTQTESPDVASADNTPVTTDEGFPVAADLLAEVAAAEGESIEAPRTVTPASLPLEQAEVLQTPASQPRLVAPAPAAESAKVNDAKESAQTIRVGVDVLENLMTLVSEMVLTRNQLLQISRAQDDNPFKGPVQRLNRITSELQESVMKTRMQPIGNAWSKLPRIVRDLASELGKKIDLQMVGAETDLDRQVLELIRDPLTHMVRNSADHGLEGPADRLAAGKPEMGTIRLSARHEGGHIVIEIVDDGRGLNTDRIRAKIAEKGLATAAELATMDENLIHQFIMKAGFSTAEKVTNVSGRGVGMDVVRSNIEKIGGTLEFRSVQGTGSTFTVKIPLTLAIVNALIIEVSGQRYAIPQIAVREVVRAGTKDGPRIESIAGAPVIRLRNRLLPVLSLSATLNGVTSPTERSVVVCRSGALTFGVAVDRITEAEEIVVKPLSELAKSTAIYSGNTILGDGTVILILDVNALAGRLASEARDEIAEAADAVVTSSAQNVLLFRSGSKGIKAVTLDDIYRIEHLDMSRVEWVQGQPVIQYRDELLSLTGVDGIDGVRANGHQHVLVFVQGARRVGLTIDQLDDIVADEVNIARPSQKPGILGSQIVSGHSVDFLDPAYFLSRAAYESISQFGEAA